LIALSPEDPKMRDRMEIYCPQCRWRPAPEDRWACEPRCGTLWNTFWTRGLCPSCRKQWGVTQCLACKAFSPHRQWYHVPRRAPAKRERVPEKVA
jgi:hypothetical protein